MSPKPTRGKPWAYLGAILGGSVSVAANVAHSFLPPTGVPEGWRPEPGAVAGAIVWPVILFVAVEILARVLWPAGWTWKVVRFGGLLPVAGVAALVSYRHLSGLLDHYGEEPLVVKLGPIAIDGLMLMATGALLAINHRTGAADTPPVPVAAPSAVTPATAPVAVVSAPAVPAPVVPAPVVVSPPAPVVTPAEPVAVSAPVAMTPLAPAKPAEPVRRTVETAPSTTDTSVSASDAGKSTKVPGALLARAAQTARTHQALTGTPITIHELAERLDVGSGMATRLMDALGPLVGNGTTPERALNGSPVQVAR